LGNSLQELITPLFLIEGVPNSMGYSNLPLLLNC
jgi:hypothetical protein